MLTVLPQAGLPSDARGKVGPWNSFRGPWPLHSNNHGQQVDEARCACPPRPCASRRHQGARPNAGSALVYLAGGVHRLLSWRGPESSFGTTSKSILLLVLLALALASRLLSRRPCMALRMPCHGYTKRTPRCTSGRGATQAGQQKAEVACGGAPWWRRGAQWRGGHAQRASSS